MDPENDSPAPRLPDDLVVDVFSRLSYKSFCRCKCVCKDWFVVSSNPHYCKKLPNIPTGLLYQRRDGSPMKLASLPHNDEEFDETLRFLPQYEQLELMDSCNGLVLCKYKERTTPLGICRFIVCNPATREWRLLPDTSYRDHDLFYDRSILAYSPSWSPKFYVFNFKRMRSPPSRRAPLKLQVFLSDLSTWFLENATWLPGTIISERHMFIEGALYVQIYLHKIAVLKSLEIPRILPTVRIIELPHEHVGCGARYNQQCFGQSSGALHYALPEEDARSIHVWSLNADEPYKWSLKYRLNMSHAFGRDNLCEYDADSWKCDYDVITLDLEGDGLLLFDKREDKLRLVKISTGELTEIQPDHCCRRIGWDYNYCHYAASYSKLPALTM